MKEKLKTKTQSKTMIILSASSDIGWFLTQYYLNKGWQVIATYRRVDFPKDKPKSPKLIWVRLDMDDAKSMKHFIAKAHQQKWHWHVIVNCVGEPRPVQAFFQTAFNEWHRSVEINAFSPLEILHGLNSLRHKNAQVIFFAGGGMNNAVLNFSAYTISKIILTKMCEFLDAEERDLKIAIIGPGWVKTKIHQTIVDDPQSCRKKVKATRSFLAKDKGTALNDIAACLDWVMGLSKKKGSGRNFSVVYDAWKEPSRKQLEKKLEEDVDMYKLRRHGNEWRQSS